MNYAEIIMKVVFLSVVVWYRPSVFLSKLHSARWCNQHTAIDKYVKILYHTYFKLAIPIPGWLESDMREI